MRIAVDDIHSVIRRDPYAMAIRVPAVADRANEFSIAAKYDDGRVGALADIQVPFGIDGPATENADFESAGPARERPNDFVDLLIKRDKLRRGYHDDFSHNRGFAGFFAFEESLKIGE